MNKASVHKMFGVDQSAAVRFPAGSASCSAGVQSPQGATWAAGHLIYVD